MTTALWIIACVALIGWLWLVKLRGGFWRMTIDPPVAEPPSWPPVAVLIPARDEAATIAACITNLLDQDYPGGITIILIDDLSTDGTADSARLAAAGDQRLRVIAAAPLPKGWSGKLWALDCGLKVLAETGETPVYILCTDADIRHAPDSLRRLVARAESGRYDLVSEMVRLSCATAAEKLMIPAFVFFFRMLYPFAWVNDPDTYTAAGAGGAMLVRKAALDRVGGFADIKGALIDDCALASLIKQEGPIYLALSERTESLRHYPKLGDLLDMIARTAFTQLGYSWGALILTVLLMLIVFCAPPFLLLAPSRWIMLIGLIVWIISALAYAPALRFYGMSCARALTLPLTALIYVGVTIDSARRYALGQGGAWKGRTQEKIG